MQPRRLQDHLLNSLQLLRLIGLLMRSDIGWIQGRKKGCVIDFDFTVTCIAVCMFALPCAVLHLPEGSHFRTLPRGVEASKRLGIVSRTPTSNQRLPTGERPLYSGPIALLNAGEVRGRSTRSPAHRYARHCAERADTPTTLRQLALALAIVCK